MFSQPEHHKRVEKYACHLHKQPPSLLHLSSPRNRALSNLKSNQHVATAADADAYDGECSAGYLCYRLAVIEIHVDDVEP
jgi:hypothetical protein